MLNEVLEQFSYDQTIINLSECSPVSASSQAIAAPLALLYPPTFEAGVFDEIKKSQVGDFKKRQFIKNSTAYSALIIFAKYAGLMDDIELLDKSQLFEKDNVPYADLYDTYSTGIERISNWLNREETAISNVASERVMFSLDTDTNINNTPALWLTGEPFPCCVTLSGDEKLDQMINSLLFLFREEACMLLPEDLLGYGGWFLEQGEALDKLKAILKTDDLAVIAKNVFENPEPYVDVLDECEFLDELDEESILENFLHIDKHYEPIPEHLLFANTLSHTDILKQLLEWHTTGDTRINDSRISAIKKGLAVYHHIQSRRKKTSKDTYAVYLDSEEFRDGDFTDYLNADNTMFVQYGLRFEEHLANELYEQSMQMGEEPSLFLDLSPIANRLLHDKLLNMAQAHGVARLLEFSF